MLPYTCCYTLPKTDCGLLAVVLSRWDDIVGPKTIRVWCQEQFEDTSAPPVVMAISEKDIESHLLRKDDSGRSEVPSREESTESVYSIKQKSHLAEVGSANVELDLFSGINYVTNHTVNCLSVNVESGTNNTFLIEKGTSFFAVPDVNLVFLSLMFLGKEGSTHVPYSFALIASYDNYRYLLQLRGLCLQWLRRIAFRFCTISMKKPSFDSTLWKNLNDWIVDFCNILVEVKQSGLVTASFPVSGYVVHSHIIKRALTSHLQTFGCSVVIGGSASDINDVITFLGLFLDETDKYSSSLINPPRKYSYHMGLKLQGLLLDEYGGRDLASLELMSNPIPVTIIDLTIGNTFGAVKQTSNFHEYLFDQEEIFRHEYRFLYQGNGSAQDHESVMHNVRETGRLVDDAIQDLQVLPVKHWEVYVKTFLEKLKCLALSLLSLVSWMRCTGVQGGLIKFPGESRGGVTFETYLKETLKLEDADFLIILCIAEKLKPGTYVYIKDRIN